MKRRALVVDDDPLVLAIVEQIVEDCGFDTVSTTRSREAVTLLAQGGEVGLVVTDVDMPEVTGPDVFHAARQHRPDMPIVYLTGRIPDPLKNLVAADRHAAVLQKPFTLDELSAAITSVL